MQPGRLAVSISRFSAAAGLGKSFVMLYLAARISRGDFWPTLDSGSAPKSKTIILSGEDALEYTIKPRLQKMCADRARAGGHTEMKNPAC